MRSKIFCLLIVAMSMTLLFLAGYSFAADESEETPPIGVKSKGVIQNIAQDRRVERVGGIYEPEGLDIYLSRHIGRLSEEITKLGYQIASMENEIKEIHQIVVEKKGTSTAPSQ